MKRSLALAVIILAGILGAGLPYYALPIGGRVRSPLHNRFRSSGYVGQTLGIIAFVFFIFLWLYPLRKRFRWLAPTGAAAIDPAALGDAVRAARQEIALAQQLRLLGATQRLFRFWHVAHRPVAVTALVAVFIQVIVVIAVGSTWFH